MPAKKTYIINGEKHDLQWYYDRIGKRIKRINGCNGCKHELCKESRSTGLIVHNQDWADHLYYLQENEDYRYTDMSNLINLHI